MKAGKIEKGSVLLIESLDRLSRDNVADALSQFLSILRSGIEIVTLTDNQCYTEERINRDPGALFVSLGIMMRANEESEIKSKRISAAWKNKRAQADEKPMTKLAPAWLTLSEDRKKFEIIEERAKVVRDIFHLCVNSFGIFRIAKHLNETNVPVFGTGKIWYRSYIVKILTNRSVLGEFQPHIRVDGKRQAQGETIHNYYPAIVDQETFHLATAALRRRSTTQRGRKGVHFTNILSGLAYCGACGSKMSLRNRGAGPKGGLTLCCSAKKEGGVTCKMPEWDLPALEQRLFLHLREVDYKSLANRDQSVPRGLEDHLEILRSKLTENEEGSARLLDALETAGTTNAAKEKLIERLNRLAGAIEDTKQLIVLKERELALAIEAKSTLNFAKLKQVLEMIKEHEQDYQFRSSLNQLLAKTIERIELHQTQSPFQNSPIQPWDFDDDDTLVKAFRASNSTLLDAPLEKILALQKFRQFVLAFDQRLLVRYRTGSVRHIFWGDNISILNNS